MIILRSTAIVALGLLIALAGDPGGAVPLSGDDTVLPPGTELNEDAFDRPREVFHSEVSGGRKSYLVNLGDIAFSSPAILGGAARQAGISCKTCHVNGASNAKFFVPGMSTRPGNFDTTGALFNPKADNAVRDPVRIPSLRGARYLAPYGHDGRMASLRDFVRNVIVNEFAGDEPSAAILDAIVAYIQDIDFLPNPMLGSRGRLVATAREAERHGEALFFKPFPHDPQLSCAACHIPSGAFVDHLHHDISSGGLFKTPTLLNANFNAPYFHDGRFDHYEQVVDHFDRVFDLGLSVQDQRDLITYLLAVGNGVLPYERDGSTAELKEITDFVSVLGSAIAAHDMEVIVLTVDTVGRELRELIEQFPDLKDGTVSGGRAQRGLARATLKELAMNVRRIEAAASRGDFDSAAKEYRNFHYLTFAAGPKVLKSAEPWSLFNPEVHSAHYGALRQMIRAVSDRPQ
jgi:cytochrome c peroxidase